MNKTRRLKNIDKKLSILLDKMDYDDYLYFIKNNKFLKRYDEVMADDDYQDLPYIKKLLLTNYLLTNVEIVIDDKLKKLGITK